MRAKQGFIPIAAIVAILALLGAGTYFAVVKNHPKEPKEPKESNETQTNLKIESKDEVKDSTENKIPKTTGLFGQQCSGSGTWKLKTFPLEPKNIELITPM